MLKKDKIREIRESIGANKYDAEHIYFGLSLGVNENYIYEGYKKYIENKAVMSNNKLHFGDYFKKVKKDENYDSIRKRFENFNDDVSKTLLKSKAKKLMRKISSKKDLINEETEKLFITLAELNVSEDFVQNNIAKKVKAFKTNDELNEIIRKNIESLGNWNIYSQRDLLKKNNINLISEKDNKVIFEVNDFESSRELGSPMWCITREQDSFEMYRDDVERIVFCFDFNKPIEDNESKTAYIIGANGSVSSGYFKDDSFMNKKRYSKMDGYFSSYDFDTIYERLTEKHYTDPEIYLKLFNHGMESHIPNTELEDLKPTDFNNTIYADFLNKRNPESVKRLASRNPDLLLHGGRGDCELLSMTMDFSYCVYSSAPTVVFESIINNKVLINSALEKRNTELLESPIFGFSFLKHDNRNELFKKFVNNTDFNILNELKQLNKNEYNRDVYDMIKYVMPEMNEIIKLEAPDIACTMLSNHCREDAIKYLNIKNEDDIMINYLRAQFENKTLNIKNDEYSDILKRLKSSGVEIDGISLSENVRHMCYEKPRKIFTMYKDLDEYKITYDREETLDMLSNLVFEKKFSELDDIDLDYLCEDLTDFNLAKPILKRIINSPSLEEDGVDDFFVYLEELTECAKLEEPKFVIELDNKITYINGLRESSQQKSIQNYLQGKICKRDSLKKNNRPKI